MKIVENSKNVVKSFLKNLKRKNLDQVDLSIINDLETCVDLFYFDLENMPEEVYDEVLEINAPVDILEPIDETQKEPVKEYNERISKILEDDDD